MSIKRTCKSCLLNLPLENFTNGKYNCKSCRNKAYKDKKINTNLKKRTELRNQFFNDMIKNGLNFIEFKKNYIKHEDFNNLKKLNDYEFVYDDYFKKLIQKQDKKDNIFLDCLICLKSPNNCFNKIVFII